MPVYDQVKQALQDVLAPEIQALKAEIKRLDERITGLEEKMVVRLEGLQQEMVVQIKRLEERISGVEGKMESLRNELLAEIKRVDGKVDNVKGELLAEIRRVDATREGLGREVRTALEIRERLAALEARVGIGRP